MCYNIQRKTGIFGSATPPPFLAPAFLLLNEHFILSTSGISTFVIQCSTHCQFCQMFSHYIFHLEASVFPKIIRKRNSIIVILFTFVHSVVSILCPTFPSPHLLQLHVNKHIRFFIFFFLQTGVKGAELPNIYCPDIRMQINVHQYRTHVLFKSNAFYYGLTTHLFVYPSLLPGI